MRWWRRRWVWWTAGIVLALVVLLLWPTTAVAIYYTASNARSARQTAEAALRPVDHNEAVQRRTHELTEQGQVTDRFTAAVARLGETSPAVRLGGVHALAGIADDAPAMRQTCINVLCAYLRLPYTPDPGSLDNDQQTAMTTEEREAHERRRAEFRGRCEVRYTIIRLIGNHLRLPVGDPRSWQGHDFDFTGVIFDGGDLHGACFTAGTISFARATFTDGFDFRSASFLWWPGRLRRRDVLRRPG
ncbi:hypothetical protein [Thermomonospora cellulosilytica]|uniref:Pentapeptide repeat protein n=1 Tax=Thermomonospora cellulosilytica TaxID=1411118 RepID=A0A7W3N1C7_9ACTN|nr:hypothetical protein [Thermomonospora cellulosilytica]MBA9005739.1 hypothetical protein [Thermomonospora cellulosilytica]